ncbi:hypothetical protein P8452_27251 [Trifolium repens]|nr:hypothetical protein P8452_27251 [Trifolium repens]
MDDSTQPLSQPNQKKNTMKLTQPIPFPTNHHPTPQYSLRQHPTWSQSPAQETSHNISAIDLAAVSVENSHIAGFSFGMMFGMGSALETLCG